MELTRVDTVVQFTAGSANVWNNVNVPVPIGVVVIDTVNKIVKEGDGTTLFANLPICLDYNFNSSVSGAITPVGNDVGVLAISDDSTYSPSATKLSDLMGLITARNTVNTSQQTSINQINSNVYVASVLEGTPNGTIAICNDGKYSAGNKTLAQLISDLIVQSTISGNSMHIVDLEWYSDSGLTQPVALQNDIFEKSSYYCKVDGFHDSAEEKTINFGLSTTQNDITITNSAKEETSALIAAVYGGVNNDYFYWTKAIDKDGNYYAVGNVGSEGLGGANNWGDALIVKFDSDLNILAKKRIGGSSDDRLTSVVVDSNNNIIAVGYTNSEGLGGDALIVKFDSNLNILARKRYGGGSYDEVNCIAIDSNNNIICTGHTTSEGLGGTTCLVIKFDSNLNILARKIYGGTGNDYFYGVYVDSSDNVICVGWEYTDAPTINNALVIKFDSNLNILARKRYGGTGNDYFHGVVVDTNNNVICVGITTSEGLGLQDALIVKFDSNLNILAKKRIGGANNDVFHDVAIDKNNDIICGGYANYNNSTIGDALIVKFDTNLNILTKKQLSGAGFSRFHGIAIDSNNNIICTGHTTSEGLGGASCLIVKFPSNLPSGSFTGSVLTGLTLADSNLTLADSNLTLANSALTLDNSILTLADSALTLANSNLTFERDIITAARTTAPTKLLTSVYSSAGADQFNNLSKDASGNYYAVGYTTVGGVDTALIVKYDSSFNTVARKTVSGVYSSALNSIHFDVNTDIVCCGWAKKLNGDPMGAFAIKFNRDLNTIITQRILASTSNTVFLDSITVSNGNWYAVGYTEAEGSGLKEGFIVKFGVLFNPGYRKRYGGTGNDVFTGVSLNTTGHVFVVGYTTSEGANTSGFILKLDSNGNILLRKYYNSTLGTATVFNAVVTNDANVTFAVGSVTIGSVKKGLIVKMDTSLNVTGNKLYGNNLISTEFTDVKFDVDSNVVIAGKTNAEGAGDYDALIMKMTQMFVILGRKTYGTFGADGNTSCSIDTNNDINITGFINRNGSSDAIIAKIPSSLPQGVYAGKTFTDLVLSESRLTLSDDSSTVNNSALTMADSDITAAAFTATIGEATGGTLSDTVILDAVSNVFRVNVGSVTGGSQSIPVTFNITADDGKAVTNKSVNVNVQKSSMITALYGGVEDDYFIGTAIDSEGNIYIAGSTKTEGVGSIVPLIVKYDNNLNVLAKKYLNGTGESYFSAIAVDKDDYIYCAGLTANGSVGINDAYVVKFDKNLNVIHQRQVAGTSEDGFTAITIDNAGFVVCCGYTRSEGASPPSYSAFVMRLDTTLSPSSRATYGGPNHDVFYGVAVDSDNNVYCAGYAGYTGVTPYSEALIVKYDSNLTLLSAKVYGNTNSNDSFQAVAVDSNDHVICVGWTGCEGPGTPTYANSLIVKFDSNFNILARKYYGGVNWDEFKGVTVDSENNIYITGATQSEGTGNYAATITKTDTNLNNIFRKIIGGTNVDYFSDVAVDAYGNIICCGYTISEGSGNNDALVVKLPSTVPSGTYTGTILTGLTMADSNISGIDSTLTLANAALTVTVSTLVFVESNLTLTNSNLTSEREVLNF